MFKSFAVAAVTLASVALAPSATAAAPHTACEYEDSTNCVWDARHMGNGIGRSFIVHEDGSVTYVSHRRAHRLLNR